MGKIWNSFLTYTGNYRSHNTFLSIQEYSIVQKIELILCNTHVNS